MSYVRVDSSVPRNRKFAQAGPAASWLWLCGLAYCQEGLTDGFIPFEALRYLGVEHPKPLIPKLVKARLWDEAEGGWQVHDYLERNKPASEIRRINKARAEGGNLGGRPTGTLEVTEAKTLEVARSKTLPHNHSQNPSDTQAQAVAITQGAATAQSVVTHTPRGATIHQTHKNHAACGRVCVPADLHARFVRSLNRDDADRVLRDWYLDVDNEWSDGALKDTPTGGDDYKFWRARFDEKWPAPVVAKADPRIPKWAQ